MKRAQKIGPGNPIAGSDRSFLKVPEFSECCQIINHRIITGNVLDEMRQISKQLVADKLINVAKQYHQYEPIDAEYVCQKFCEKGVDDYTIRFIKCVLKFYNGDYQLRYHLDPQSFRCSAREAWRHSIRDIEATCAHRLAPIIDSVEKKSNCYFGDEVAMQIWHENSSKFCAISNALFLICGLFNSIYVAYLPNMLLFDTFEQLRHKSKLIEGCYHRDGERYILVSKKRAQRVYIGLAASIDMYFFEYKS